MRNSIQSFLLAHAKSGACLCAAVSGGMDSMAMLDVLRAISEECGYTLIAAHFNHMLRGEESDRDETFVRTFCEMHGIPLKTGRGDVAGYAAEQRIGLEEAARSMRYDFFASLEDADCILTAHTADDNLETVLMHLVRGTGLHGLTGIPPVRGKILRPMLGVSRAEIEKYCEEHQIPHVEDSSNDTDQFLRNRIRHSVIPLLLEENPSLLKDTAEMCRILSSEDRFLQDQAERFLAVLQTDGMLSCTGLLTLPEAMRPRVLALYLSDVPELGRVHLESALGLAESSSPSAVLDLPGGIQLRRVYDGLELTVPDLRNPLPEPVSIMPGQTVSFGPWGIQCSRVSENAPQEPGSLLLDASILERPLTIRSRCPGDRIRLPGGTKKVSRLLIDEKYPAHLRDSVPILCAGDEIAAVLPLKTAESFRCRKGSASVMLVVSRMEEAI